MRISDWSSDVCSSDLVEAVFARSADSQFEQAGVAKREQRHALPAVHRARDRRQPRDRGRRIAGGRNVQDNETALQPRHTAIADGEGIGFAAAGSERTRRTEENTSELQTLMRNSYDVICLKKKKI